MFCIFVLSEVIRLSVNLATMNRLSLLLASMLGEDFTFEKHAEVLEVITKYNNITDEDIDNDIEFVKECISANIFL